MMASTTTSASGPATAGKLLGVQAAPAMRGRMPATHRGWRAAGWFGGLLAVIGLADLLIHFYSPAFGSPEWEFGTMATALASLPLPTIGIAAVVGALLVNDARPVTLAVSVLLLGLSVLIAAAYGVFALRIPLALGAATGPQEVAIHKTIARTTIMGVGFSLAYLIAGIALLRHTLKRRVG